MSAWIRRVIRRHLTAHDTNPTYSHFDHLDGLGASASRYTKRIYKDLERAWRNGEITYQEACERVAELNDER